MKHFFDIIALAALAVVVLMPRPGVEVKPAVEGMDEAMQRRIAALQARLLRDPGDLEAALEVAEIYREVYRPEWALATLGPMRERAAGDYRVHFGIAVAHAERFEIKEAYEAMGRALEACRVNKGKVPCGPAPEARIRMIYGGLKRVMDAKVDPRKRPEVVQEAMYGTIRATKTGDILRALEKGGIPKQTTPPK